MPNSLNIAMAVFFLFLGLFITLMMVDDLKNQRRFRSLSGFIFLVGCSLGFGVMAERAISNLVKAPSAVEDY